MVSSFVNSARSVVFVALFVGFAQSATAQADLQPQGRITGRVIDGKTGAGISDAMIRVSGASTGTKSVIDGRFSISSVPAGTVTLDVRRIGYTAKSVTGLEVGKNEAIAQNVILYPATVTLTTTVVTASSERGTVNEALDRQRNSIPIANSVTAEQITRSGDGDAAQAARRLSGVTLQDGKYVFVRGLGERYTTASLNGARIPSPEPERRVVPLDLFPSGLLEAITTSKTFTPDQSGDFSGAQVDIRTREFPARGLVTWSSGFGYNTAATGKSIAIPPTIGPEWLGFAGQARSLPASIRSAGDFA